MTKEIKKVTLGNILSWVFGILFILLGMGMMADGSAIAGIIVILLSAMLIPYSNKLTEEHFNFHLSGGIKFALVILILIVVGFGMASGNSQEIQQNSQRGSEDLMDEDAGDLPQKTFITKSYGDLWNVFSPNSDYTELQRETIFKEQYQGNYVTWTGRVKDVDASVLNNLKLYVEHRNKGDFDLDGGDMTIYMNPDQHDALLTLKKGDEVTYSGRFTQFSELFYVDFYLEDGEIIS